MQPVQLSLLPEQVPAPLPELIGQLPDGEVTAAVTLLAAPDRQGAGRAGEVAGDE